MLKIPRKQPETTVFTTNFLHSRIRLHLSISFFSAKCNLNRGNLIGPRTVFSFPKIITVGSTNSKRTNSKLLSKNGLQVKRQLFFDLSLSLANVRDCQFPIY